MTYHGRLGQVPSFGPATGLPTFAQAAYEGGINHQNNVFGKIGDEALLNTMMARLVSLGVADPSDPVKTARRNLRDWIGDQKYELREDGPFIQALKAFWVRMGRNESNWPSDTDFGPSTNASKDLHISTSLYDQLKQPPGPWAINSDGFVRLRNNDYLWSNLVKNALVRDGYVDRGAPINTKDDGPMVQGLHRFFDEAQQAGIDVGRWPSGFNFGPNTNGDEVRIDDKLLRAVLTPGMSARAIAAQTRARAELAGATIKKPIFGTVRAQQRPLVINASKLVARPLLTVPLLIAPKK